ncbi:MAG: hypothetical protein IKC78_05975, partial [Alistipes sp.]|nr:hypothetical protein [Alistipes sp.]
MKFFNRLFLITCSVLSVSLISCVDSEDMPFEEVEKIALKAWIEINRPDLLDNFQPIGEYYVELLDEGHPDSLPVRSKDAWVWFDVTCRDLAGNVVLTRKSDLARMQNSYTEHTHYVPFFLYVGTDNVAMPEGTYLSLRSKLRIGEKVFEARYGTKMRLYLPSSIGTGDKTMGGEAGYEGQYILDANRPMIVEVDVWGSVANPVAYEDQWIKSFAKANGGLAPEDEKDSDAASKRRSYMRSSSDESETVYDNEWHLAVDSIAGLYINYLYTPKQSLEFNCLGADTLIYEGQTEYKEGKVYGTKSLADINREVDDALVKRFGRGLNPADAEPLDSVKTAKVWYVTRLLDGFIIDSNIPEVKRIVYDDVDDDEVGEALEFVTAKNSEENKYVDAWIYAIPQMKLGAWNAILTTSSNAYGATGVSGQVSSSGTTWEDNYWNYYNY